MGLRLAYLGNHIPSFSTETHVARSFEALGHSVTRIQEGEVRALDVPPLVEGHDLFLWTCTHGLAESGGTIGERMEMLARIRWAGIPTAGFHLDKYFDVKDGREERVGKDPFFLMDRVFTADGGNQERFEALGVAHRWLPPGIYKPECELGTFRARWARDVAFVGGWRPGYHPEWKHRGELILFLRRNYRGRLGLWPDNDRRVYEGTETNQIRSRDLADLYASTKVLVGDSCMVGGTGKYWSDRIPESLGRGGFLLHPHVEGIEEHFTDGKHLRLWPLGDWNELRRLIDYYVEHQDEARAIAEEGRRHVLEHHTYEVRARQILEEMGLG